MLGEFLYGLTQKDAQTQPVLQRTLATVLTSQAAVSVSATITPVPNDKVLFVTLASAQCNAGAGQTTDDVRIVIEDDVGNSIGTIGRAHTAANLFHNLNLDSLNVVLMPGERLRATGTFNAAGVANLVFLTVHGFMLPRGNLQLR